MSPGFSRPVPLSRRSFLAGSAALVALGAAGCAPASRAAGGGTGLRFYLQKQEVIAYFGELLRRFEDERPGITVVHDSTVAIAPQFVRNEPAGVGCFNDNLELARYIKRGVLGDLSDLPSAQTVRTDIDELTDQYATYPGRTSVLPYSLAAAGVIYNKKIFADHQLPVPETWTQFVDVCDELTQAGVTPIYATDRDTWTLWQGLFDYSVGSLVAPGEFFRRMKELGTDVGPDSEVSFEKDFAVPMERAKVISSYFNKDHAVRAYADGNLAFGKGQAAMYLQGPWALSQIELVDPDLEVGTFPLPVSENPDERQARVNIDLGLWIPTASQHQDEARELVEFLMRPDILNAYNADNLAYSTLIDAPPQQDERLAGLQDYVDRAAFYQGAGTFVPTSIPLGNYLQAAIRSGNFDGMLRQLDADWRRLAGRGATV
ncbi:ABC transporter substrate-binding protein [Promicromonospora iranensis]|uniref:Raffinose/stachyose/melibiose transport system substrate-binding protein n=1 Tax=Promicromonospora iranensis TaxID=1105144 RepID=A0ABU2CTW3_9MICO|nr:extracellular solute-binding protein [Promicromonospora iranensis]MDR7384789.1 raffinose/stachyose/melibiose transport system substrate-binding protein [Promicromonospora iranensis]